MFNQMTPIVKHDTGSNMSQKWRWSVLNVLFPMVDLVDVEFHSTKKDNWVFHQEAYLMKHARNSSLLYYFPEVRRWVLTLL